MYRIDVFQTFRFQIYMQVLNDETIEQQKQFIQWTTRLLGQIKMPQYSADLKLATEIGYAYAHPSSETQGQLVGSIKSS